MDLAEVELELGAPGVGRGGRRGLRRKLELTFKPTAEPIGGTPMARGGPNEVRRAPDPLLYGCPVPTFRRFPMLKLSLGFVPRGDLFWWREINRGRRKNRLLPVWADGFLTLLSVVRAVA